MAEIINHYSPSNGPCLSGYGILVAMSIIPISLIYFFIQVYLYFEKDKSYYKCLLLHLLIWTIYFLVAFISDLKYK